MAQEQGRSDGRDWRATGTPRDLCNVGRRPVPGTCAMFHPDPPKKICKVA